MFGRHRMARDLPPLLAALCLLAPNPLWASWLGVRNKLNHPVVLQVIEKRTDARPSAVQRLYPGEVTWVWVEEGSKQRILVHDAQSSRQPLAEGEMAVGKLDVLHGVESKRGAVGLYKLWEGNRQKDVANKPP